MTGSVDGGSSVTTSDDGGSTTTGTYSSFSGPSQRPSSRLQRSRARSKSRRKRLAGMQTAASYNPEQTFWQPVKIPQRTFVD